MTSSFAFIGAYVLLAGFASFIEVPIGRGLGAYQLNVLIRVGSLAAAVVAVVAVVSVHGLAMPTLAFVVAGLGIGVITGVGSIFYCIALEEMQVSIVVTLSNLYLVVTTVLGFIVLNEPVTLLKLVGLAATLAGVLLLARTPTRYGVNSEQGAEGGGATPVRTLLTMAVYVVIVGVGAFLEKPALKGLDATQLNVLMAIAMTAVACVTLAREGPRLPMNRQTLGGLGVGAIIGVASIFYFVGLQHLPVTVAAAASNAYVVVTVVLSIVFFRQPLTWSGGRAIALTLLGVTLLALSAG